MSGGKTEAQHIKYKKNLKLHEQVKQKQWQHTLIAVDT